MPTYKVVTAHCNAKNKSPFFFFLTSLGLVKSGSCTSHFIFSSVNCTLLESFSEFLLLESDGPVILAYGRLAVTDISAPV